MFDRDQCVPSKALTGFIDFIAEPLFTLWAEFCDTSFTRDICRQIDNNRSHWEEVITLPVKTSWWRDTCHDPPHSSLISDTNVLIFWLTDFMTRYYGWDEDLLWTDYEHKLCMTRKKPEIMISGSNNWMTVCYKSYLNRNISICVNKYTRIKNIKLTIMIDQFLCWNSSKCSIIAVWEDCSIVVSVCSFLMPDLPLPAIK